MRSERSGCPKGTIFRLRHLRAGGFPPGRTRPPKRSCLTTKTAVFRQERDGGRVRPGGQPPATLSKMQGAYVCKAFLVSSKLVWALDCSFLIEARRDSMPLPFPRNISLLHFQGVCSLFTRFPKGGICKARCSVSFRWATVPEKTPLRSAFAS
jgi:hypothetical protein